MIIHQCDRCGKQVPGEKGKQQQLPEGWYTLTFGSYRERVAFHLCPECKKILKIPDTSPEDAIGDRLLEIISELVAEEVEAQAQAG